MSDDLYKLDLNSYLCPYCQKWHELSHHSPIRSYDASLMQSLFCVDDKHEYGHRVYRFQLLDTGLNYYIQEDNTTRPEIKGTVENSSICFERGDNNFKLTFKVNYSSKETKGNFLGQPSEITLGFEIGNTRYGSTISKEIFEKIEEECEHVFNSNKLKATVNSNDHSSQELQVQVKENKENVIMTNNNFNVEFGPNADNNIISTLMGVAVKSGDTWRIYDKKERKIIDVGNLQLGNFPIFIIPTTKLDEGDLVKYEGEYYFVEKKEKDGYIQFLSANTGEIKNIMPIKNILGFEIHSKVVTFNGLLDDSNEEMLTVMLAMSGQNGKDNNQMNQLLTLLLLKDKHNADDDMMKLMFMSSMMGNNEAISNNPVMTYLMLKNLTKEKKEKESQNGKEETAE